MPTERFEEFTDPVDGTRWRIDVGFLESNWTCIWGRGCRGILESDATERNEGCCSVGAELLDADEAMRIAALAATLSPETFQHARVAAADGVFRSSAANATRIVDGACIFLNRPGFIGGAGCALHLAALADGDDPMDWKPSICWQLPLKAESDSAGLRTLRRWTRDDWGPDAELAWCCTEDNADDATAYVGHTTVAASLHAELVGIIGPEIAVELRDRAESGHTEG